MGRYAKPPVPRPEWAHYLWKRCLFAAAHGWQRGHDETTDETTQDDVNRIVGAIDGSVPGTIIFDLPGWSASAGNSLDIQKWADSAFYDFPDAGMSAFMLFRMIADGGENAGIFGRGTGIAGGNQGWYIRNVQAPNTYRFRVSDGGGQDTIDFGSYTEPGVWQQLGVTMSVDLDVVAYQNAEADASATFTNPANTANPNDTVKIFGDDTGPNDQIDGDMSMSAFWSIELSHVMLNDLEVDPFVMWKPLHPEIMLGDVFAFAFGYNSYMGAF